MLQQALSGRLNPSHLRQCTPENVPGSGMGGQINACSASSHQDLAP